MTDPLFPPIATIRHHALNLADELAAAIGCDFVGQTVNCDIGDGYNGSGFRQLLAITRQKGYALCLWDRPNEGALDKGEVDVASIAEHPSVDDMIDALKEHIAAPDFKQEQGIESRLGEIGNKRPGGGLRYISPEVGTRAWLDMEPKMSALRLKDGRRFLLPTVGWEPSAGANFKVWMEPLLPVIKHEGGMLDWHPYDCLKDTQNEARWKVVYAGLAWAMSRGIPNAFLECGCVAGNKPVGFDKITDGAWRRDRYMKRVTSAAIGGGVRAWMVFPNSRYSGYAGLGWVTSRYAPSVPPHKVFPPGGIIGTPWYGSQEMTAYTKKLMALPEMMKK